jgi:Ca2+-binding RTX toxin-like protein
VQLVNFSNSTAYLYLRNGTTSDVTALGNGSTDVILQGTATATSIQGSDGNNLVEVQSATAWNPNITIDGGTGFDNLYLYPSNTTLNLQSATLTNLEYLYLGGSNLTALIDADAISSFTTINGNSGDRLVTADAALDLTGKSVSNATIESTNATGTTFTVNSSSTAFQVFGGPGSDTIQANFAFTASQRDAIFNGSSIELIHDTTGFYGDETNNTITGTAAADNIQGGGGADRLIGGSGNDFLSGGSGADTFVFAGPTDGLDTITDFDTTQDVIQFSPALFANYAAVMDSGRAQQVGSNTVITVDANDTVTLSNVNVSSLNPSNFTFG